MTEFQIWPKAIFIVTLALGILAAPLAAHAQQQLSKVRRIGYLASESVSNQANRVEALRAGLRDLGYVEGKNIVIEFRWADGQYDHLARLAAELAGLKVDVIVTSGTKATVAAKRATTTIPIVMGSVGDAVAMGIVTSLARPGGNITGWTFLGPELTGKRLELLKEAIPRIRQVAFLENPADPTTSRQAMEITAKALKVSVQPFEVRAPGEFDSVFAAMARGRVDAVVVQGDTMFAVNAKAIADVAVKHRLPLVGILEFARAGGLIALGPNLA